MFAIVALSASVAAAADYPAPRQSDWIAPEFTFHGGETTKDLRQHYVTIGDPSGQPVLIIHGTAGSAASMLTPAFAGELFGRGQPLDLGGALHAGRAEYQDIHPSPPTG